MVSNLRLTTLFLLATLPHLVMANTDVTVNLKTLTLYVAKNQKTYPIAAGKLDNQQISFTPVGTFHVLAKNPHPVCTIEGYAPTTYGSRLIQLDVMGRYKLRNITIHGTDDPSSIGTYVSSGCIRMRNEDIEEIYPLISHNATVEITD